MPVEVERMVDATCNAAAATRARVKWPPSWPWRAFALVGCSVHGCAAMSWSSERTQVSPPDAAADVVASENTLLGSTRAALAAESSGPQAGRAALAAGDLDAAAEALAKAGARAPSALDVRLDIAQVWLWQGLLAHDPSRLAQAGDALHEVLLACPDHPLARRLVELLRLAALEVAADAAPDAAPKAPRPAKRGLTG